MFSRSFKVFGALFLAVLVGVWAYALLGLSGPEEVLRLAQAKFDHGEYQSTIDLLNGTEHAPGMQKDRSKRARLLRLRYSAQSQLDNAVGAKEDLENLLAMTGQNDPALRLDQIRLLAIVGEGDRALQLARTFLQQLPADGTAQNRERALELAGEACQTTYRDELANVFGLIERDLGTQKGALARTALLAFLYRPDGDQEVQQGIENLRLAYSTQSVLLATWPGLLRRLQDLRARVQEGLDYFQKSLEAGGAPVAAMRALALSLDQSKRTFDLLTLCESYRQRFTHKYVFEAGAAAAWAQVRAGQNQGAIATAVRWLPPKTITERLQQSQIDPQVGIGDLLLARCVAAWRLGDRQALERLAVDIRTLDGAEVKLPLVSSLMYGVLATMRGDWKNADGSLRGANYFLQRTAVAVGQQDLMPELVPLRVKCLRELGNRDNEVLAVLTDWAKARPADQRPLLAQARFQLDRGQPTAALAALEEATRFAPNDSDVFALRLQASALVASDSSQDGEGLFLQCVKRGALFPEVQNPLGYLLCAETALKHGAAEIARESASYAIDKFPSAREPRLLKARAEMMGRQPEDKRPAEAARILLQLLDEYPKDEAITLLALQAHREANLPLGGLLAAAMRNCSPSPVLTAELLRSALADGRSNAIAFVPNPLPEGNSEIAILAAHALAKAGRGKDAEALLAALATGAEKLPLAQQGELAAALVANWQDLARTQPDAILLPIVERNVVQFALGSASGSPSLLQAARDLEKSHPQTAYALCIAAFAAAAPEQRRGADLVLAGRLASTNGHLQLAADHFTAALAFADGRAAAEPLARLCYANGHSARALQAYQLATAPQDGALAMRAGDTVRAQWLAVEALQHDGADLLAQTVMACLGQSPLAGDLTVPGLPERQNALELASMLDLPELGTLALPRAQALVAILPQSPTAQLLLARALRYIGRAKLAATVHGQLFAKQATSPIFWREIALAAADPEYPLTEELAVALATAAAQQKIANSPVTQAFSLQRTAALIEKSGNQGIADQMHVMMWMTLPAQTKPTVADAEGIASRDRLLDAWWVFDKVRPTLTGAPRRECIERMFAIAATLAEQKSPETELLCQAALRFLSEEGPQGCVLHFLLDHGNQFESCRLDEPSRRKWLLRHLDLAARGQDPGAWLDRTTARLEREFGATAARIAIEESIAAHPTCLTLWHHRAQLLAAAQQGADGIHDLRMALRHATSPAEQLAFVTLAAAEFELLPDDVELLARLPKTLLATPEGALAQGLVALHRGDAVAARQLLEKAAPQPDGLHLVALALAQLQSTATDAIAQATATLTTLAKDYASSSLARYAGSFARQLAPR